LTHRYIKRIQKFILTYFLINIIMASNSNDRVNKLGEFGDYRIVSIEITYKIKKQKSDLSLLATKNFQSTDMPKCFKTESQVKKLIDATKN
jgi:hypothetical protein